MAEPGTKAGNLLPYISSKTGLNVDTPVFLCASHDTASAFAAVPASPDENIYLSSGTWSLLGVQLEKPILSVNAMNNFFTNEGGINLSTCFLKNIIGLWPLQECRRQWITEGKEYTYPQLAKLASEKINIKAWINLDDARFLKAGNMPEKILSFLKETGQPFENSPGFITAVILESLAFNYRTAVKNLKEVTGREYKSLHAVGGGIQNELLTQYISDVLNIPVYAGPVEGAVIGNIGVQAIASGAVPGISEWHEIIKNSFPVKEFKPVNNIYFAEQEKNYNEIINHKKINN
jgi:rhamnulokinase